MQCLPFVHPQASPPVNQPSLFATPDGNHSAAGGSSPSPDETILRRVRLKRLLLQNAPVCAQTEEKLRLCISAALQNPGSLFRAELALQMADAFGLLARQSEAIACAVEYFHIASLLLDDLPSMDDSLERRGHICLHLLFGENSAILTALSLITRAYSLLGECIAQTPAHFQQLAHHWIERCLGSRGILNGQARDLAFQRESHRSRYAEKTALQKTASLIVLPMLLPAILAGKGKQSLLELRRLAICWGLLYQGIDDLADTAAATTASTGKTRGRDLALGRPNVALQLGPDATYQYLSRLATISGTCIARLNAMHPSLAFLQTFHAQMEQRRNRLQA